MRPALATEEEEEFGHSAKAGPSRPSGKRGFPKENFPGEPAPRALKGLERLQENRSLIRSKSLKGAGGDVAGEGLQNSYVLREENLDLF